MSSKKSVYPLRWRSVRLYPEADGSNATTLTETRKDLSFDDYVDAEISVQRRILQGMGCDKTLIDEALSLLENAMQSAGSEEKTKKRVH